MEGWEKEVEEILKSKGIDPQRKDNDFIQNLGRAIALACLLSIGAGSMSEQEIEDRKELISRILGRRLKM